MQNTVYTNMNHDDNDIVYLMDKKLHMLFYQRSYIVTAFS